MKNRILVILVILLVAVLITAVLIFNNKTDKDTNKSNVVKHESITSPEYTIPVETDNVEYVVEVQPDSTVSNNKIYSDYGEQDSELVGSFFNNLLNEDVNITVIETYNPEENQMGVETYEEILLDTWDSIEYYYMVYCPVTNTKYCAIVLDGNVEYSVVD